MNPITLWAVIAALLVTVAGLTVYLVTHRGPRTQQPTIEARVAALEVSHQKLSHLPIEWENAVNQLSRIAGRIDKQAARLKRPPVDEEPEDSENALGGSQANGNSTQPPEVEQKVMTRQELLASFQRRK